MTTSRVSRVGLVVLAGALLTGCAGQGATVQGQQIHDLYVTIAILAAPVFVGVEGVLLWCIVRYRSREGGEAFQWQWTFYYLNEGFFVTGKTLTKEAVVAVPVGEPVHVRLESRDVVHEFFGPEFLFMRNALAGRPN